MPDLPTRLDKSTQLFYHSPTRQNHPQGMLFEKIGLSMSRNASNQFFFYADSSSIPAN